MAVPAAVKHRRAGDERIGAGGYAGGAGPGIDAAVDFEADRPVADHRPQPADPGQHRGDEGLAAEAGVHGHRQDRVEPVDHIGDRAFGRGRRLPQSF